MRFLFVILLLFALHPSASAQFCKPVVVLKGVVKAFKPVSALVSFRLVRDTSEIVTSRSNRESGRYLVILKPGEAYSVRVESDSAKLCEVFAAPDSSKTVQMDFNLTSKEAQLCLASH